MATGQTAAVMDWLKHHYASDNGVLAAFSLIFLSELGDKTFFIAALLAMRMGRLLTLFSGTASLGVMTIISVALGRLFNQLPALVETSFPLGEYLGAAMMVFFGVRSLRDGLQGEATMAGELADAEEAVEEAETSGKVSAASAPVPKWRQAVEVFSLIFVAEWGDRSMLATIALGASRSAVGVTVGATMGHFIATIVAVVGGSFASKYISEKTVSVIGGVLFLLFAALTVAGVF